MDFVDCREDLASVTRVPLLVGAVAGHSQEDPAHHQEANRDVAVIDEETCLPCALEAPVHGVSTEQGPAIGCLLCVPDLIFY